jgi:acetylglutamate kinase
VRILVKIGGAQLEQPGARQQLCAAIHEAKQQGHEVIVVHGGGNQIRSVGQALGQQDRYHEGLRITDRETADTVLMVLGGLVNRNLVQSLAECDVPAVGITGADGGTFTAKPLLRSGVDLGYVGSVDHIDGTLVESLLSNGFIPVIATVAPGNSRQDSGHEPSGNRPFFNINADHAAGPLCRALGCDALLFLTDVDGVFDAQGRLMPLITDNDCERLISTGVATGGMQPKLESAQQAAQKNPHAIVKIAPANAADCVLAALRDGSGSRFFSLAKPNQETGSLQHG